MAVFLAKGARDFLPDQMRGRLKVIDTLRRVFSLHGFAPLETPAFERIETLTGKAGENEKLMYRILKRGEGGKQGQCDLALRYDLTVPLARVLAMHPELRMPFKRYQIQPVWRADRPQKGRFREFWQCDVDIAGSNSPLAEAECLAVMAAALRELGFANYTIRINDRRILRSIAKSIGAAEQEVTFLVALDKLDKIGREGVSAELSKKGFEPSVASTLWSLLEIPSGNEAALTAMKEILDEEGLQGTRSITALIAAAQALGVAPQHLCFDPTLARGLDYYTGPVFEIVVQEPKIGSIAGGGRYDHLVGMFSGRDVPAVGASLGLERILVVMEELGMLHTDSSKTQVFITRFSDDTVEQSLETTRVLREQGISCDLYTGDSRLKSQFKYANAGGYSWVIVIGPDEAEAGTLNLRNLQSGSQTTMTLDQAVGAIKDSMPPG
jgi:histidyl-tRNA synthetase